MKIIIKKLLDFFDYFTQAKILGILKNQLELEKPIILIDVGAHKGEYIFSISKNFLIKKIYAFEPNFDIYKILEKNTNQIKDISIFNYGISDKDGNVSFYRNIESSSSSILMILNFVFLKKKSIKFAPTNPAPPVTTIILFFTILSYLNLINTLQLY